MSKQTSRTLRDSASNLLESWKDLWKWIYLVLKSAVKWIYDVFVLWYDALKAWDEAIGEKINNKERDGAVRFISDKMLRTLWALWIVSWLIIWWQKVDFKDIFSDEKWSMTEFIGDDPKVFWLDVSRFNDNDVDVFTDWATALDNSGNPDKRRPKFVYILWRKEKAEDPKAREHYKKLKEHKNRLDKDLAVGSYAYFNKSANGITDEWLEKQVDEFITIYNIINQDGDWLVDIVPMLDFEFSANEKVIAATTEQWQKYKEAVLKWLKLFEKKTWVTPGIYANASTYHDYFYGDPSFAKYPSWIACYSNDKVNQDMWIVTYHWDQMDADIIQFSEQIKKSGLWNNKWNVDWNTSTKWDFWKLIQDNSDTPNN